MISKIDERIFFFRLELGYTYIHVILDWMKYLNQNELRYIYTVFNSKA